MDVNSQGSDFPKKNRKKIARVMKAETVLLMLLMQQRLIYAAADGVTGPINNLKDLMISIVSAIGACIVVWGGFEFGNAMQTRDGAAKSDAIQRIVGGLIMVVISQVVNALI